MPSSKRDDDQFEEAVKPALESLLSDLQKTTEVLRRGQHQRGRGGDEADSATLDLAKFQQQGSPRPRDLSSAASTVHSGAADEYRRDPMLEGDKLGIHTIPKGDCAQCNQAVIGPVVIALGKMWHPEHFLCSHCGDCIDNRNFFERQGKAYCENDYHDMFSPRCSFCNGPIKDRCITAMGGKTFHEEHFTCAECGRPFGNEGFHEKSNSAYCRDCFFRAYAPKCNGCNQPITRKFITALNTHWHPECFCCRECGRPFHSVSLFDHFGRLLCEMCLHTRQGSLCAQCRLPISGRCVSAMGRKYHPEHFTCSYCNGQLSKGTFKECNGRSFCIQCYQTADDYFAGRCPLAVDIYDEIELDDQ